MGARNSDFSESQPDQEDGGLVPSRVRNQAAFVLKGRGVGEWLQLLGVQMLCSGSCPLESHHTFLRASSRTDGALCSPAFLLYMDRKMVHLQRPEP